MNTITSTPVPELEGLFILEERKRNPDGGISEMAPGRWKPRSWYMFTCEMWFLFMLDSRVYKAPAQTLNGYYPCSILLNNCSNTSFSTFHWNEEGKKKWLSSCWSECPILWVYIYTYIKEPKNERRRDGTDEPNGEWGRKEPDCLTSRRGGQRDGER